jgi:hypothetical protein
MYPAALYYPSHLLNEASDHTRACEKCPHTVLLMLHEDGCWLPPYIHAREHSMDSVRLLFHLYIGINNTVTHM